MISLSDFRSIFLYKFKLNQSAAETDLKINQAFDNYSVNELFDVSLRDFVPEILVSKVSPEVVNLQ